MLGGAKGKQMKNIIRKKSATQGQSFTARFPRSIRVVIFIMGSLSEFRLLTSLIASLFYWRGKSNG